MQTLQLGNYLRSIAPPCASVLFARITWARDNLLIFPNRWTNADSPGGSSQKDEVWTVLQLLPLQYLGSNWSWELRSFTPKCWKGSTGYRNPSRKKVRKKNDFIFSIVLKQHMAAIELSPNCGKLSNRLTVGSRDDERQTSLVWQVVLRLLIVIEWSRLPPENLTTRTLPPISPYIYILSCPVDLTRSLVWQVVSAPATENSASYLPIYPVLLIYPLYILSCPVDLTDSRVWSCPQHHSCCAAAVTSRMYPDRSEASTNHHVLRCNMDQDATWIKM